MLHAPMAARRTARRLLPGLAAGLIGCLLIVSSTVAQTTAPTTAPATQPLARRSADMEVRFNQGRAAYNAGRFSEARNIFEQIVGDDPDDASAHYMLGMASVEAGAPSYALRQFDEALRLDRNLTAAHAGRAGALIQLRRLDEAQSEAELLQADPEWKAAGDFLAGQIAYARKDYATASRAFGAARQAGGDEAGAAGFYQGVVELEQHHVAAARSAFRDAADLNPNSTFAIASRQAEALLAAQSQRDKRWSFELQTGYEYDSNVVLLDSGIPAPSNISRRDDGRFIVQPHASYSFVKNDRWEIGIDTTDYLAWQNQLSDYDIASYDVGAYANYQIRQNLYAGIRYDFNYLELGHDPYLKRNLVTPQLTMVEPKFGYTSLFYQFDARQFDSTGGAPQLDRDGKDNTFGIVQGINVPSLFRDPRPGVVELSYQFEAQSAKGSDFDGDFHTIGLTYRTPLPWWKLKADAGFAMEFDEYSHPNSLDFRGDRRHDFELRTLVGITKDICPHASVRVDYAYTNNDSNVSTSGGDSPYSYDRHVVGIRLIVTY